MIEKERKFKLDYLPEWDAKEEIKQAYLLVEEYKHLRIRIIDDKRAYIAFKIGYSQERLEYEYEIPYFDGLEMYINSELKLEKTRYKTSYENNNVDIDIYPGGLAIVEIEFKKELNNIPDYCGEEVTGIREYSNISIAHQ